MRDLHNSKLLKVSWKVILKGIMYETSLNFLNILHNSEVKLFGRKLLFFTITVYLCGAGVNTPISNMFVEVKG